MTKAVASIEQTGQAASTAAAGNTKELAPFTSEGTVTHAVNLKSTMDGRYLLSTKPYNIGKEDLSIWMWRAPPDRALDLTHRA